jgi:hypothetical protein
MAVLVEPRFQPAYFLDRKYFIANLVKIVLLSPVHCGKILTSASFRIPKIVCSKRAMVLIGGTLERSVTQATT